MWAFFGFGGRAEPPIDRWKIVYITLMFHGLGTLTAWNMFITAKDYFVEYKLKGNIYADNYLVYVGYAAQLPNLLFSWINVFVVIKCGLTMRIVWSLSTEVLIFIITIVLGVLDTSLWQGTFFWITMATVFILCASNAVYQNSVYGVAGRLPKQYTGAVVLGTNVVGTAVVLLNWATSASGDLKTSAILYFAGGMIVLLICIGTYFALPFNKFFRHYVDASSGDDKPEGNVPYCTILRQCWVQLYNVFIVFFVSLAVFPAIHSDIYSIDNPAHAKDLNVGFLGDNFMRVTCFLTFNLFAMIGNITAIFLPFPSRRWLVIFTTARLVFIPLFLMCNYHPLGVMRTMAVYIKWDGLYWTLAILLGWSSGHFSSLAMMYVGGKVDPEYAVKAGMLAGAMLVTGTLVGITFSGLGSIIVTSSMWT